MFPGKGVHLCFLHTVQTEFDPLRVCVCMVWTDTEDGVRSSCVGWFHPHGFVLSARLAATLVQEVCAGISSGCPCQHETLGHLPLLMATLATGAQLRAGLWDPHSSCKCIHEGIQPWHPRRLRGEAVQELPSSEGSEDTLRSSPSPPLGITNLFGKWRNCLQRCCTSSRRTLWRLSSPAIALEPGQPAGRGSKAPGPGSRCLNHRASPWMQMCLWTFAFPFLPFSPHHLTPSFKAEEILFPDKVLY